MGDNIEDMDIETTTKDNKTDFLENKIRLPDSEDIEQMNKLGLIKISSKRQGDRSRDRLRNSPINHNNNNKKKQKN